MIKALVAGEPVRGDINIKQKPYEMRKQAHLYYSGKVQGVGFRFTAREIADSLNISGWVRNSPDGRVEILAEGKKEDLENFLAQIQQRLQRYISTFDIQWQEASGTFKDFQVLL